MSERALLIRGGRIVDPARGLDRIGDVLIREGRIAAVGDVLGDRAATEVDAAGCVVAPGLIDLHVHLREPGFEGKETIATGTAAAAAGGFTAICCMPNTRPVLDSVEVLEDLRGRIARDAKVRVYPIAAITEGRAGKTAVDFAALAAAGAIGFSDDGDTTADSAIMRRALEASVATGRPVMTHCEDKPLASGAMHEGKISRRLGIAGIPAAAEEIVIARDLMLARLTGGWLHVCHVSTGRGIEMIAAANADGVKVTAEVMPHHLVMTDEWVAGSRRMVNVDEPVGMHGRAADPNTKVNPPLRPASDARRLLEALKSGLFDIIATDHAPHAASDKSIDDFAGAANGLSGLEFALPIGLALVRTGHLTMSELIYRLSTAPAALLGEPFGTLATGSVADVVVFDPEERWIVTPERLKTKSANTPLLGMELRGRARWTIVNGQVRHHA